MEKLSNLCPPPCDSTGSVLGVRNQKVPEPRYLSLCDLAILQYGLKTLPHCLLLQCFCSKLWLAIQAFLCPLVSRLPDSIIQDSHVSNRGGRKWLTSV